MRLLLARLPRALSILERILILARSQLSAPVIHASRSEKHYFLRRGSCPPRVYIPTYVSRTPTRVCEVSQSYPYSFHPVDSIVNLELDLSRLKIDFTAFLSECGRHISLHNLRTSIFEYATICSTDIPLALQKKNRRTFIKLKFILIHLMRYDMIRG